MSKSKSKSKSKSLYRLKNFSEYDIQDITNKTDKVLFLKQKYYSPQKGKTPNGKITTR